MDLIFVFLTQVVNHTSFELGLEVDGNRGLLPKLRKGKTRYARRIRKSDPGWKIRVLIDGEFSGIELDPEVLLKFVRVVFSIEEKDEGGLKWKALCVHGALENHTTDFLFRHRFFGCMRDHSWNSRKLEFIRRSGWSLAAKSRNESLQRESSPIPKVQEIENNITEQPHVEPARTNGDPRPSSRAPMRSEEQQRGLQARLRDDESSAESTSQQDSGMATTHHPSTLLASVLVSSAESTSQQDSGMATRHQARLRDDESSSAGPPKPCSCLQSRRIADYYRAKSIYDESSTESSGQQSSVMATPTRQQAELRDDESPPEPPKPSSMQHNSGMATGQLARWVGDDFFFEVVLPCFDRMVAVLPRDIVSDSWRQMITRGITSS